MPDTPHVITTHTRADVREAEKLVRQMSGLHSLLVAALIQSGGKIDVSFQSMGEAHFYDIDVVGTPGRNGVTLQLKVD